MATWDDKHMYNWMGAMSFVTTIHDKILYITMETRNLMGLIGFIMATVIGFPIRYFMVGLISIPQSFEWIMANLIEVLDRQIVNNNKDEDSKQFRTLLGVVMAFAFVLPYAITWGLPNLISKGIKKRKEKLESRQRMRDVITRDEVRERWGIAVPPPPQRNRGVKAKDFKPKKHLVPHNFNREHKTLFVSPGVYTRDEFVVVEEREGNVNRAYVRRVATQRRRQLESEEEGERGRGIFR
jgi:hypothetical protein